MTVNEYLHFLAKAKEVHDTKIYISTLAKEFCKLRCSDEDVTYHGADCHDDNVSVRWTWSDSWGERDFGDIVIPIAILLGDKSKWQEYIDELKAIQVKAAADDMRRISKETRNERIAKLKEEIARLES